MDNLINGRAPEEIVAAAAYCVHSTGCFVGSCPYFDCDDGIVCDTALMRDLLAYAQHLEAQQPKWISVKERLPTEGDVVFGWLEINAGMILVYRDGVFRDLAFEEPTMLVTHWMPMPEPPEVNT